MQCFFVQIRCQLGRAYDVAEALADTELTSEIYSTSGDWDLLVKIYLEDGQDIGRFVNTHVHAVDGVDRTLTTLTFKAF